MGEKGPPTLRAVVPRFFELDRAVSRLQSPRLNHTRTGMAAVGAWPWLLSGLRGLGGCLLAKQTRHLAASLAGALLNGGEIEHGPGILDPKEFLTVSVRNFQPCRVW